MRFDGNVALIIGSATGMGRATAAQLVREGAVVVGFDLRGDELGELKEKLRKATNDTNFTKCR